MAKLNILIVEDEPLAAAQLAALLGKIEPESKILAVCDTVESAVKWIDQNEKPDLAFFDIHLGDGLCFEIFKNTTFNTPVIFTTAYDQYTLQAFKVNSIDYILKPIDLEELRNAVLKYEQTHFSSNTGINTYQLQNILQSINKTDYKNRFLVKIGNHLKAIKTSEVCYFYSFQKGTFLKSNDAKNYLLDQTLEQVEQLVDPQKFFRINRKYMVSLDAIKDVSIYSNSRLKLKITNAEDDDFFVAREKVKTFKQWMEGDL